MVGAVWLCAGLLKGRVWGPFSIETGWWCYLKLVQELPSGNVAVWAPSCRPTKPSELELLIDKRCPAIPPNHTSDSFQAGFNRDWYADAVKGKHHIDIRDWPLASSAILKGALFRGRL